ncbi:DUF6585 family protein [Streptomyces sp. NPDC058405]|uniref:DUF6585 family protein n=1 Tax=unclassified Streptomyces TaxID=2593676 RepID=UPI00365EB61C
MQRFELPEKWEHIPGLRQRVDELLTGGRRRTALDEVLRYLHHAPDSTDALFLALVVLGQSRTELLESDEPLTDIQRVSALLAPVATECSDCRVLWYSRHTVLDANGPTLYLGNPIGLQCQNCRYTLCRNCLSKGPQSYTVAVDAPELPGGPCPSSGCRGQLTTPVLPTGRHGVTPMDPNGIEGVIVARDGFTLPTMDEALVVVTKFLPLIADDAPLIHIRRSVPGMMGDESTRDELAQSLVLKLEGEGVIAAGAWVRSRRMFVLAGDANDTNYLITVVRKNLRAQTRPEPAQGALPQPHTACGLQTGGRTQEKNTYEPPTPEAAMFAGEHGLGERERQRAFRRHQIEEKDTYEPPTPEAAMLAAKRGLGEWRRTFRRAQTWVDKKHNESRLYVYDGGVVVRTARMSRGKDLFEAAYDWGILRVLRYLDLPRGEARYTLLDQSGVALNVGLGIRVFLKEDKQALGITSVVEGTAFVWPAFWGDHIEECVTRVQLPSVLARIERGETVDFGPYKVDRQGVAGRKDAAAWSEIADVSEYDDTLRFKTKSRRSFVEGAKLQNIANVKMFLSVCAASMARAEGERT